MKKLETVVNRETYRKLQILACERGMTVSDAMAYIAVNGVANFLSLNGGVHQ